MATAAQQYEPVSGPDAASAANDQVGAGPGPGARALSSVLAGGVPNLATIARILRAYPGERAELTATIQATLGNQAMTQVLQLAGAAPDADEAADGTTSTEAPTPAGPGLTALSKLIAAAPGGAPAVDAVIALIDANPSEHDVLLDALCTYLGPTYVDAVHARMPHLRIDLKQLSLVAGDPLAPTGNFLVAGKNALGPNIAGAKLRTRLLKGELTGEFGGDKGYDVRQSWANGNFIHASQELGGAEWKLGKFTGTGTGEGVDAQYAFTDVKALKLHYDKNNGGTLGYYRDGKLLGPEASFNVKSGKDYSLGLTQQLTLGKGTTGTLAATRTVTPDGADTDLRDKLAFDLTSKHTNASAYAGLQNNNQFAAGFDTKSTFGPRGHLTTAGVYSQGKGTFTASGDYATTWGLKNTGTFSADNAGYRFNSKAAYDDKTKVNHVDATAGVSGTWTGQPTFTAGLHQAHTTKTLQQHANIDGSFGDKDELRFDAGVDQQGAGYRTSTWGKGTLGADGFDGEAGVAGTLSTSERTVLHGRGVLDEHGQFAGELTFDLFKTKLAGIDDATLSGARKDALLDAFIKRNPTGKVEAGVSTHVLYGQKSRFDASALYTNGAPSLNASLQHNFNSFSSTSASMSLDGKSLDLAAAYKYSKGGLSLDAHTGFTNPVGQATTTTLGIKQSYTQERVVETFTLDGSFSGDQQSLSMAGKVDARLAPNLYGGFAGSYTLQDGKHLGSASGSMMYMAQPNLGIGGELALNQDGTFGAGLDVALFKSKISGLHPNDQAKMINLHVGYNMAGPDAKHAFKFVDGNKFVVVLKINF